MKRGRMIHILKEQRGPQKAARDGDMSRVQKPVVCYLSATSKALIFALEFVLKYIYTGQNSSNSNVYIAKKDKK